MITKWTKLVANTIPISEFRPIRNILYTRDATPTRIARKTESVQQTGGEVAPAIIHVVYTDLFNDPGDVTPHYYFINGHLAFVECWGRGVDPRDAFDFYQLPADMVSIDMISRMIIQFNHAQKKYTDEDIVNTLAGANPEYARLQRLHNQYPHVSIGEIMAAMCPTSSASVNSVNLRQGVYVATQPARGTVAVELLENAYLSLIEDDRYNPIKTQKGHHFVIALSQRLVRLPAIRFSYAGRIPAQGKPTGTIPGDRGVGARRRGNTIQFNSIVTGVLRDDVNFPKRPFNGKNRTERNNWNALILDLMQIV